MSEVHLPSPGFAGEGPGVRGFHTETLTPYPSPAKPGEGEPIVSFRIPNP